MPDSRIVCLVLTPLSVRKCRESCLVQSCAFVCRKRDASAIFLECQPPHSRAADRSKTVPPTLLYFGVEGEASTVFPECQPPTLAVFSMFSSFQYAVSVERCLPCTAHFTTHDITTQVESKYGESVSVTDISGKSPVKKKRRKPADADTPPATVENPFSALPGAAGYDGEDALSAAKQAPARRKAPTDSTNVAFEEWLRGRRPRNFLAEQVRTLDQRL